MLRSWVFALAFSTVSSLRQANAQNVSFSGELHVLGRDYLLSQHADPTSRGRVPIVFVTPLQDFSGSTAWFVQGRSLIWPQGDFLWADVQGDPRSHSAVLLRCPLEAGRIQWARSIVLLLFLQKQNLVYADCLARGVRHVRHPGGHYY